MTGSRRPGALFRTARARFALVWLLCALGVPAAHAEVAPEQEIVEATRLLESGRLVEAREIVSRLRAQPQPQLQVLFLSGALYFLGGRYQEAAEEFRLMLARDPSLIRPRLELARSLFMAGQYNAARYHFEQTLASPLPDAVRSNVLGFLSLIRERLPNFAFSIDLVSDTNPNQATNRETVDIGGLLFRLSSNARAQEALGVLLSGQAKVPLPSDPSCFARGYLEYYNYEGRALDQSYTQLLGGKHVNLGPNSVDLEAGWQLATYPETTLYQGPIWRVTDFIRLRQTVGLTLTADAKDLRYPDFAFLTGWQRTGSAEVRYALNPQSSIASALSYIRSSAEDPAFAFDGSAIGLRLLQEFRGGWIGSLSYQYARYRFDDVDPFFGVTRSDRENRAELGIANRYLSYRRFSPRLTAGWADRQSNIDLYTYRRRYLRVGVITEF